MMYSYHGSHPWYRLKSPGGTGQLSFGGMFSFGTLPLKPTVNVYSGMNQIGVILNEILWCKSVKDKSDIS